VQVPVSRQRDRSADLLVLVAGYRQVLGAADLFQLVLADDQMPLIADPFARVVFDADILVALAAQE